MLVESKAALVKTAQVMRMGNYSPKSIKSYLRELRFLFEYFSDKTPQQINSEEIQKYVIYLKDTFNAAKDKCRMVAQAYSFFCKHIDKKPYEIPSKLYPKRDFKLPNVMTEEEIHQVLNCCTSIKQLAYVQVFYSTGVRLEECSNILLADIDSKNMHIKIRQGKGRKDRFTLLSQTALFTLRDYYKQHRPQKYLFEGQEPGKKMHPRSIAHAIELIFKNAKLKDKGFNTHTLRHTFATHLLNNGTDLPTIKELLGHSKLETTMIYLHLQTKKRASIVSPLDALKKRNDLEMVPVELSANTKMLLEKQQIKREEVLMIQRVQNLGQ